MNIDLGLLMTITLAILAARIIKHFYFILIGQLLGNPFKSNRKTKRVAKSWNGEKLSHEGAIIEAKSFLGDLTDDFSLPQKLSMVFSDTYPIGCWPYKDEKTIIETAKKANFNVALRSAVSHWVNCCASDIGFLLMDIEGNKAEARKVFNLAVSNEDKYKTLANEVTEILGVRKRTEEHKLEREQ